MFSMQASKRHRLLVKNILWNLLGLGSPILVGLFTIPILISQLGTVRFGILTIIWMFISYTSLLDLGLGRVLTQQLSIKLVDSDSKACANLVWTTVILLTALGALLGCMLYLISPVLVKHVLHIPPVEVTDCINAFYILALSLPFVVATNCARGVLESHQAFGIVNVVRIIMGMFIFFGPLIALRINNSLALITLFLMGGKIVNCTLYFYACFRVMPGLFQKFDVVAGELLKSLKLGAWITVSNVINPLLGYLDRFLIAGASLAAVTYYVTPNEMVTKLWLIPSCVTAVLFPELARNLISDKQNAQILFQKSIQYIFLCLFPIVFVLIYFAQDLLGLWLGSDFAEHSYRVLQWLALGVLINSMAHIPYTLIQAKGEMHLTAFLSLIELPFYGLALWLATSYGNIETVAIVWVFRMIIDTAIVFLLANRIMKFSFSKNLLWSVIALFGILMYGLHAKMMVEKEFAVLILIVLLNIMLLPRLKSVVFKFFSIR